MNEILSLETASAQSSDTKTKTWKEAEREREGEKGFGGVGEEKVLYVLGTYLHTY